MTYDDLHRLTQSDAVSTYFPGLNRMNKKVYKIDGAKFGNLEEFRYAINEEFKFSLEWNGGFDALDDLLDGGFGTPDDGFMLTWSNFEKSKEALGYSETLNWLENNLSQVHPTNKDSWMTRIEMAKEKNGETLWMLLIDILTGHKNIELRIFP